MNEPAVTAAVTEGRDGAVVALGGVLDVASAVSLRPTIEELLTRRPSRVAFDLSALEFVDSSGIALMLEVAAQVEAVELRHASAIVRRVVEVTGLTGVLRLAT